MAGAVTIRTVAERAGCSIASVSRVMNGNGRTSPSLRSRVERAVRTLNYHPSEFGRGLKTRKTRTIGLVVPSLTNPVFANSAAGVEQAARASGRSVLIAATEYRSEREDGIVETFLSRGVEGLVLTVAAPDRSRALARLDREGVPYVLLYNQPSTSRRIAFSVDNVAAAHELTSRLIAVGHRRIVFVAGRFRSSDRSHLRYQGCARAMRAAGLRHPDVIEVDYVGELPEALSCKLAAHSTATAFFCSNDLLALSVTAALNEMGKRVPEDCSVAGFDGISLGTLFTPKLATIEQPTGEMGVAGMNALIELCEGRPVEPGTHILKHAFRPGTSISSAPRAMPRALRSARHMQS